MAKRYEVKIRVVDVKGKCAAGYVVGDEFLIEWFYIKSFTRPVCLHAMSSMMSLLMPFLKGISARDLGIGHEDDVGYVRCPDPGKPYTDGGTVLFELKRKPLEG